ncbi:MAG TPA: hypothetical protein VLL54_08230 [Pyrinomonadaceae bacterium]|nr:hypothetical protein [Pyrinomonadaceae bacterium]
MKDQRSISATLQPRRHFISSVIVGGAASFLAPQVIARATEMNDEPCRGELTAADPLYLYQGLVWQLQTGIVTDIRNEERRESENLSDKIEELYKLSTELKAKLPQRSALQPAAEHLKSLAYIGRANEIALRAGGRSAAREVVRAHARSQRVITAEIVKAAVDLPSHPEITISDEAWSLVQQLIQKIDEIKTVYQPAVDQARQKSDKLLQDANRTLFSIQRSLLKASSSVVNGNQAEALSQVDFALAQLAKLPGPAVSTPPAPADPPSPDVDANREEKALTRDEFVEMLKPVKSLISGVPQLPQITRRQNDNPMRPVAFISPAEIVLPNTTIPALGVREIVRTYIPSGTWWQVVGVTAACLPLWAAYSQSEKRKELIYNALKAVPRENSKMLWTAAYWLDRVTG